METRTVVACLAVFLAVSVNLALASRPVEEDSNSVRQEDGRSLESEIRWLKEKTAESLIADNSASKANARMRRERAKHEYLCRRLAIVAERVKAELSSRTNSAFDQVKRARINKRHCWDVADVCCMWNIC